GCLADEAARGEIAMPRPVHFELTVENAERAKAFYGTVFGWTYHTWGDDAMPYWLVKTGPDSEPGIDGGLLIRHGEMRAGTINTIGVESVDAAIETIKSAGGQII